MSDGLEDLPTRFDEYLARFTEAFPDAKPGAFVKYGGRLVKKLSFEEFTPAYLEYTEMAQRYFESMDRGDTINDLVLRLLREKAANLLLAPPG